jgi:hypothetical protein
METSFARAIEEHLELKRRNVARAPSEPYRDRAPGDLTAESPRAAAASLFRSFDDEVSPWGRARDFEWGD